MPPVATTALYAGILALIIIAMGANVTYHRFKYHVSVGDGGNAVLRRMIRIHGNAVETIPIALLLMALYELDGGSAGVLHTAGLVLIAGRLLYAVPMWIDEGLSMVRATGVVSTCVTTVGLALLNIAAFLH
jgi:uncharacterized protein